MVKISYETNLLELQCELTTLRNTIKALVLSSTIDIPNRKIVLHEKDLRSTRVGEKFWEKVKKLHESLDISSF